MGCLVISKKTSELKREREKYINIRLDILEVSIEKITYRHLITFKHWYTFVCVMICIYKAPKTKLEN